MKISLLELASLVEGQLTAGNPDLPITGFSSIHEAQPGEITFLGNSRYLPALKKSKASAVLVAESLAEVPEGMGVIRVENPTLAFSSIIARFVPPKRETPPGVHPSAFVGAAVKFDPAKVYIGPHAVIEDEVELGDGTMVHAGAFIGHGASLGHSCQIHANAVIKQHSVLGNRVIVHSGAVIGTDGFGYEFSDGQHVKIEQIGIVQLDDDVEVGSCSTIDRARFGRTWIGEGTKIDNLVQIAHNVVVGKRCLIVSQVGISGSTQLGNQVTLAGQVGVAGHLKIGDNVTALAKSGVTKSIAEPGVYTGYPIRPIMEGRRAMTYPSKVPGILDRLKAMEKRVMDLESRLAEQSGSTER